MERSWLKTRFISNSVQLLSLTLPARSWQLSGRWEPWIHRTQLLLLSHTWRVVINASVAYLLGRLCGLVVRVLGYRSGGLGSIPGTTKKKKEKVGLERSPLSLVTTTEELFDRKVAAPVWKAENTAVGIRHADHVASSIRKKLAITSPTSGGRSVGIVRSSLVFFF
jgi:hypothetical protein